MILSPVSATTYLSRQLPAKYFRHSGASLLCSEWEQVGPQCNNHRLYVKGLASSDVKVNVQEKMVTGLAPYEFFTKLAFTGPQINLVTRGGIEPPLPA